MVAPSCPPSGQLSIWVGPVLASEPMLCRCGTLRSSIVSVTPSQTATYRTKKEAAAAVVLLFADWSRGYRPGQLVEGRIGGLGFE